ncbi:hypothetical protein HDU76_011632, partial [Blyttiomyces sp. JEL0837]
SSLHLEAAGSLEVIPILIGKNVDGAYEKFKFFDTSIYPEVKTFGCSLTVREIVSRLFKLQGVFMDPTDPIDKLKNIIQHFTNDVWPKYRPLWGDQDSILPERILQCVQCKKDYRESDNAMGSCSFHSGIEEGVEYSCCNGTDPCQHKRHRSEHHSEYKYTNFYDWMWTIKGSTDGDVFAELNLDDYRAKEESGAAIECGAVLPSHPSDANKLYLFLSDSSRNWYFQVFSESDLLDQDTTKPIATVCYVPEGFSEGPTTAEASWIMEDSTIIGMQ